MIIIKKVINIILIILLVLIFIVLLFSFLLNKAVKGSVSDRIITNTEAKELKDIDCILVLGCGVKDDGRPSDMLRDRLETALDIYNNGNSKVILVSGDHSSVDYDEVNTMKDYLKDKGVPSIKVFMDHAGFSTYETMYRAKEIFEVENVIVITQKYHLFRALFIANEFGLNSYGVSADLQTYRGQKMRDAREVLARVKDYFMVKLKPKPTYLGDTIPVSGNGDITNDK